MIAAIGERSLSLVGDGNEIVRVRTSNRGDPFRDGVELEIEVDNQSALTFLEKREALELRDLMNRLYP